MAWNIPREKMNNNPLCEDMVRKRFEEKGYKIIEYTYKNNMTRMPCYDKNGYIVMVSLCSLSKDVKQYQIFSLSCNVDNLWHNIKLYREKHNDLPNVLDWKVTKVGKNKSSNRIDVLCECEACKNKFWTSLYSWKTKIKTRCNKCTFIESNLEFLVEKYLINNGIKYERQYKFDDCKDKRALPFDFYIIGKNVCIEVDGQQHYRVNAACRNHVCTEEEFFNLKKHDDIKTRYCKDNGIKLLRLPYKVFRTNKYIEILQEEICNQ